MINAKRTLRFSLSLGLVLGQAFTALFSLSPALPARAAALTVTSAADSGAGSLRQALIDAQPGDTITFNLPPDTTITVSEPLTVTQQITVDGSTAVNLRVSGGGSTRVFDVTAPMALNGFTVMNGNAIESPGVNGGGVASTAALTLTAMSFLSNTASSGGGVYSADRLVIESSRFANNVAYVFGGGVQSGASTEVRSAEFIGNIAELGGGMHHYSGTAIINNALFARNVATSTIGAGLLAESPDIGFMMMVIQSTFASQSPTVGSAIHVISGVAIVVNSIVSNHDVGIASQESTVIEGYNLYSGNGVNLSTSPCAFFDSLAGASLSGLIAAPFTDPTKLAPICVASAKPTVSELLKTKPSQQAGLDQMLARLAQLQAPAGVRSADTAANLQRMHSAFEARLSAVMPAKSEPDAKPVVIHRAPLTGTIMSLGNSLTLDPAFVDPASDDYHLTAASPAINIGLLLGDPDPLSFLFRDFEGDARPLSGGIDAGYDEINQPTRCYATADDGATVFESYTASAVQQAVDTNPVTGTVKVAGYCAAVQARNFTTQTLYIAQPLIIRGGYTSTNWLVSDPAMNPTVLDAQQFGRVVYITETHGTLENITVQHGLNPGTEGGGIYAGESLTLTNVAVTLNGSTMDFGSGPVSGGGGAYVGGDLTISNTTFMSNTAYVGGGAAVLGNLHAVSSTFFTNFAWVGGGAVISGTAEVSGSLFDGNAAFGGGGLMIGGWYDFGSLTETVPYVSHLSDTRFVNNESAIVAAGLWSAWPVVVTDSEFVDNFTTVGAGIFAMAPITLTRGLFENNQSASGAGLYVITSAAINNTRFISNSAQLGAGVYMEPATSVTVANTLFARNAAAGSGSALYMSEFADARLLHTTIASPTQSAASAIQNMSGTLGITNSIIASHTVGVSAEAGEVIEDANVFFGNGSNLSGTVTATIASGGHSIVGDPSFVDTAIDNYRLNEGSPAIDLGVDAGVYSDIDNAPRPQRLGFDAGYFEWHYETITGLQAMSDSPTAIGQITAFSATIATGSQVTYTWDFGDGSTGSGAAVTHTYAAPGAYTATVTATNLVTTVRASLPVSIIPKLLLPLVLSNFTVGPDLVIQAITVSPGADLTVDTPLEIVVTVKNQGASVASGFWVDLYLNPRTTPSQNATWSLLCAAPWPNASCFGGAWYVTQSVQPGQTITLTSADLPADSSYSHWLSRIPFAGTHSLYAYVDTYADEGEHGQVHEARENNNLYGPVAVTVQPSTRASRSADVPRGATPHALQPRSTVVSK